MTDLLLLLAGFACAASGGDLFVSGAVRGAAALRVPPAFIGVTVAAFATSAPEISVAVATSLAGEGPIAFGNLAGANVVNLTLVLGLALLLGGLRTDRAALRRDLAAAMAAPAVTALLLLDGTISRIDGAVMLGVFLLWLLTAILSALRDRRDSGEQATTEANPWRAAALGAAGLALLVAAGTLVAESAPSVGRMLGLDEFVIGATLVALGTTLPELATVVAARLRGQDEVGLGAILGSCLFNGLFILGLAASIAPVTPAPWPALAALAVGGAAVLFAVPPASGALRRRRGVALLLVYAAFVALQVEAG